MLHFDLLFFFFVYFGQKTAKHHKKNEETNYLLYGHTPNCTILYNMDDETLFVGIGIPNTERKEQAAQN